MKLTFNKAKLMEIVAAVESGSGHCVPYTGGEWEEFTGKKEDNTPGLILVGDQGVYFVGNHNDGEAPAKSGLICYADQCNPDTCHDWWEVKDATFGGDDGAEFLSLEEAKRALLAKARPYVELSPTQLVFGSEG